jgi:hypothetical protein
MRSASAGLWAALALTGCIETSPIPTEGGLESDAIVPAPDGGADSGPSLADFTGAPWVGTQTTVTTCGSLAPLTTNSSYYVVLNAAGPTGLTFTSQAGCVFDFTVSGNTATLSDAPVMCSVSTDGGVVMLSYLGYTLTSDGVHLTGSVTVSSSENGFACMETDTITAAR